MLVANTLIKKKHSNKSFDYFKGALEHAIKMKYTPTQLKSFGGWILIHIGTFCFEFSPHGVWYVRTFLLHM